MLTVWKLCVKMLVIHCNSLCQRVNLFNEFVIYFNCMSLWKIIILTCEIKSMIPYRDLEMNI